MRDGDNSVGPLCGLARLILVHKQPTSARTRFLRFPDGVVAPKPLPKLSQILDDGDAAGGDAVIAHPAMVLHQVALNLGLDHDAVVMETDFSAHVDTPEGMCAVYLGRFTSEDPPFEIAEKAGARFIAITEARDLTPTDLELLRRAYDCVME